MNLKSAYKNPIPLQFLSRIIDPLPSKKGKTNGHKKKCLVTSYR